MMSPQISLIIPVYNVENYIIRCLESTIHQTYINLEIILVDDGSTDNSGKICDEYALSDKRITVIHQTNQGLSMARNNGIDVATGDYISFIDSDDWIEHDMYEFLYHNLIQYKADISMCKFKAINELGEEFIMFQKQDSLIPTDTIHVFEDDDIIKHNVVATLSA